MFWKTELQNKIASLREKHSAQEAAKELLLRHPAAVFEQRRQQALGMQNSQVSPYAYGAPLRAWPQGQQHQGLAQLGTVPVPQDWQVVKPVCPDCAALPRLQSLHQDVIAAALLAPALVPRLRLYEAVVAASRELLKLTISLPARSLKWHNLLALLQRLDTGEQDAE